VIELFGTGIRHGSVVSATLMGQNITVQYHHASSYMGEDQVNILIPPSLYNVGVSKVVVSSDGQTSNTVTIDLE
jgi:uncharacterized protein (TIGR03437 family)